MSHKPTKLLILCIVPLFHFSRCSAEEITVRRLDGKICVEIGGKLFTEYIHADCENPFLYPVIGPHEIGMTRNYPMREVPGESHDHAHHTSIWFGHDGINGIDFWRSAQPGHGRVAQDKIVRTQGGDGRGMLETTNKWVGPDGKVLCRDRRVLTFYDLPAGRAIDWQISLMASDGDLLIRDTEEGTMGIRTHPNLRLQNGEGVTTANGRAHNSRGITGKDVWGKRAEWIDYWGKINGQTVGIALFDHPQNPRHPTWWHARPYGLFTANPFGQHDFGDGPVGAGNMAIAAGDEVTFRYRFLFHDGSPDQVGVDKQYDHYSRQALSAAADLPLVPVGFQVSAFAREPLVRNACVMAFDARGRLCVGQGSQYRHPQPDTPGDRVSIVMDTDGDGVADEAQIFADGFNHIQGLAWRGDELWVANAPDLTVVRDLDGDDQADEYRIIYGGLGNLEHALHGLNFAPDGRLYMSKGNSKGYANADSPELRIAPRAFAELWGVELPVDSPDMPEPETFTRENYQRGYHEPADDWGSEGGILRCEEDGLQLEIFSRGSRNNWDIAFDEHFNWVGTDQDQDGGDRILSPFRGSHFGWGHPWSSHWTGDGHLPTVPISGPVFHGSGTGVIYGTSNNFPERFRGVFFCADWLNRNIFVFRPKWDGALMRNMDQLEFFAAAPTGRAMSLSTGMLFDPTDLEFGPDGALWVASWGHGYGAHVENGQQQDQGRIFRIFYGTTKPWKIEPHRQIPYSQWTVSQLINDLRHDRLPIWRINAQDELVIRGAVARPALEEAIGRKSLPRGARTWLAWTLGRMLGDDASVDNFFANIAVDLDTALEDRIQALRIMGFRARQQRRALPETVATLLDDSQSRVRFAAVQAIHESQQITLLDDLWQLADREKDRGVFYVTWRALSELVTSANLRQRLNSQRPGVRRAALLALLENSELSGDEVYERLRLDTDPQVAQLAASFVEKVGTAVQPVLRITADLVGDKVQVSLKKDPLDGLDVRYTLDGSYPTKTTGRRYRKPFQVNEHMRVTAALFKGLERVGPVLTRDFSNTEWDELQLSTAVDRSRNLTDVPVEVTNLQAASGNVYQTSLFKRGEQAYVNRAYTWNVVVDELVGQTMIQTNNDDADVGSRDDRFLTFTLLEDAIVYVAHDRRIKRKPDWLGAFTETEWTLATSDTEYRPYKKTFSAGSVTLGGNTVDGVVENRSQYTVFISPAPLIRPLMPTTIEDVLTQLSLADSRRGSRLFFGKLACGNCHRLGNRGRALAPDLTNLGTRAIPQVIAESILAPNAAITEGFQALLVQTDDGRTHSGFIRQESGLNLELVDAEGRLVKIPKSTIEERRRQPTSVMPSGFADQYGPDVIADLIAFITEMAVQHGKGEAN